MTLKEKFRLEINKQLMNCSSAATPIICKKIQSPEGYREIESRIINLSIKEGLTPASAIAFLESELT